MFIFHMATAQEQEALISLKLQWSEIFLPMFQKQTKPFISNTLLLFFFFFLIKILEFESLLPPSPPPQQ